jgi:DNA-binding CsgD family transcriptional regulator
MTALGDVGSRGEAMLLNGDPGIGKTALLESAADTARAQGFAVFRAAGAEAEAHLPYAGLHKLLWPLRASLDTLPQRQGDALRAALGLIEAEAVEGYLVALATMNLLGAAADDAPLLLVVDDAHWLDASTVDVLAFLARRIGEELIVLLVAARTGISNRLIEACQATISIEPLSAEAATCLLAMHAVGLASGVRRRLLREAAGNPLALIELPTAARTGAAGSLDLAWIPLTRRLEGAYAGRVAQLPPRTQVVLEVAAVDDDADLDEILTVATLLGGEPFGSVELKPAMDARLARLSGSSLSFSHPLVRSAIYQGLGADRRREVHRTIASVQSPGSLRSIWNLAAALSEPDEDVAAALEKAASNGRRLGSAETVVIALERAAQLSPHLGQRADRLLGAADAAVELGRPEIVTRLLKEAADLELNGQQRARLAWIHAAFDDGLRNQVMDASALGDLAESVGLDGHPDLAVRILWSAALRCFWTEPGAAARAKIVTVAESLPLDPMDPRLLAILGYAAPVDRGEVVIRRIERLLEEPSADPQSVRLIGSVAVLVGMFDTAIAQSSASLAGLREQGRLQLLARALAAQAWAAAQIADIEVAVLAAVEADSLADETGQPFLHALMLATRAKIAALRGDFVHSDQLAVEAERIAVPVAARSVLATAEHARAIAALGQGDYTQAFARLLRMHQPNSDSHQLALSYHTLADLADAAFHSGRRTDALPVLARMEAAARLTPSQSLHDALRLARGLLADDERSAEAQFAAALAVDLSGRPFVRARTELAYGEWLRRQRHPTAARDYLRSARDTFDALGVTPFGDRARRELRAAGERSQQRQKSTADILTGQELQVAKMAATGLTNKEIGARLYISHRTVGAHLARIYAKLGVTSRIQLHAAVGKVS